MPGGERKSSLAQNTLDFSLPVGRVAACRRSPSFPDLTDGRGPLATDGEQAKKQFERFLRFFERLSEEGSRLCIGGRLSADFAILPEPVRDPFRAFMAEHVAWLEELCRIGQKTAAFKKDMPAKDQALMLRAAVQGAVQLARANGDVELYRSVAKVMRRQILA
ncbi:MAG: TetR family transcriptional regulator [Alphaproteobacteria bacterium]|nr:TetR family transcriptional regulator [Alphaproteobacteria bacterium]